MGRTLPPCNIWAWLECWNIAFDAKEDVMHFEALASMHIFVSWLIMRFHFSESYIHMCPATIQVFLWMHFAYRHFAAQGLPSRRTCALDLVVDVEHAGDLLLDG